MSRRFYEILFVLAASAWPASAIAGPPGLSTADIVKRIQTHSLDSLFQVEGPTYFGGDVLRVVQLQFNPPDDGKPQPELILTNIKASAIFIVAEHIAIGGYDNDNYRWVTPTIRFVRYEEERIGGPDGQVGRPGKAGVDGSHYGERGTRGSEGSNGETVRGAQNLPDLYLISYDVAYPANRKDWDFSTTKIDLSGLRGGDGGDGGAGGRGGNGRNGEVGRLGTEGWFNFFCIHPTAGGAGADGSPGGDGGDAADGGNSANIFYGGNLESMYKLKTMVLVDRPAPPGKGGKAGPAGKAGSNGIPGEPVAYCPHPFFAKLPDTRDGDFFRVSHPGNPGTSSGLVGLPGDDKEIPVTSLF